MNWNLGSFSHETLIGLEIMKVNLKHAQSLMATFRWQVVRSNLNVSSVRQHLEPTFQHDSETFRSLSPEVKDSLWTSFVRIYNRNAWAHFLVNFVLGFDILPPTFGKAYPNKRINREILEPRNASYGIDKDWKPQV
ncbi:MAG: hypothetical protein ABIH76_03990 [Candidatus Bathyarchaeota archaeon]